MVLMRELMSTQEFQEEAKQQVLGMTELGRELGRLHQWEGEDSNTGQQSKVNMDTFALLKLELTP